jgi:hypothetical protein
MRREFEMGGMGASSGAENKGCRNKQHSDRSIFSTFHGVSPNQLCAHCLTQAAKPG